MTVALHKTAPFLKTLVDALNSLKGIIGTLTDPGHTHTAGAITATAMHFSERMVPPAPGATIHSAISGGGALNVSSGFTQMIPATNIRLSRSGAGVATVYTVTGTRFGSAQTENINSNGASDVEGVKIFDTVTSITSDVDPTVTTTVKTGVILGTAQTFDSIDFLGVGANGANGVAETATANAAKDGFTPTTAPDGSKVFQIRYKATPAATSAATASATTGITTAIGGTSKIHWSTSEVTIRSADATDLASAIVLVNEILAVYQGTVGTYPGHVSDLLAHKVADTTNVTSLAKVTTGLLADAQALANDLKAKYNLHRASTTYHQNADSTNAVTSANASGGTATSLITLVNEMKGDINAHLADAVPGDSIRLVAA